jgi:AAA domain/Bifunctional DNA primase/polymerase, N-terminal
VSAATADINAMSLAFAAAYWVQVFDLKVVPLHSIEGGVCSCGNPNCRNPGKHPRTPKGFLDATDNLSQIIAWWKQWPTASIGMPCRMNNRLVVDVDPRHGGVESFAKLEAACGPIVSPWTYESGSGGQHRHFLDPGGALQSKLPKQFPGIDFKSEGYVILPPSSHASGGRYHLTADSELSQPVPAMPEAVLALLTKTAAVNGSVKNTNTAVKIETIASESAAEKAGRLLAPYWPVNGSGLRDDFVGALTGGLGRKYADDALVLDVIRAAAEASPEEDEVEKRVDFATRTLMKLRGGEPQVTGWPSAFELGQSGLIDVLPAVEAALSGAAEQIAAGGATHTAFVPLSSIEMKPVPWLWPGYLPSGAVTLLVGDPGKGKTLSALDIAARVSTGKPWPDGVPNTVEPSDVLILSAEDSSAYTIRPRLQAAGADVDRVYVRSNESGAALTGLSLTNDLSWLEAALDRTAARLIIVDPLSAYMPGIDTFRDNDVRSALAPFVALAERRDVVVIAIIHMNKNNERSALQRVLGSTAFSALARAVYVVVPDPDALAPGVDPKDQNRRFFLSLKMNVAKQPRGLAFRVAGVETETPERLRIPTARAEWESGTVDAQADDVLRQLNKPAKVNAKEIEAELREMLKDGPVLAKDIGEHFGKNERTLRRYRERIGSEYMRDPADVVNGPYYWLPRDWPKDARAEWIRQRSLLRTGVREAPKAA